MSDKGDLRDAGGRTGRKVAYHLALRDAAAPVYEGESEREALVRAAREIPAFRERAAHVQAERAAGYPSAISEEEVDRFLAELAAGKHEQQGQRRIPGPVPRGESGNVRVRMPPKLHRELAQQAQQQGVSLNMLILTYLAREAGYAAARRE